MVLLLSLNSPIFFSADFNCACFRLEPVPPVAPRLSPRGILSSSAITLSSAFAPLESVAFNRIKDYVVETESKTISAVKC